MHVEDPVAELLDEEDRVDELVDEVARIEVEAEGRVILHRGQRPLRGVDVVGDLGRVNFERELHALGLEDVEDRRPAVGEVLVAGVDVGLAGGREEVELAPHAAAGEAVDDRHAELLGGAGGVLHLLGAALAHPFGIPVAPQARGEDALVAGVDRVANALAHQVRADGVALEVVLVQDVPAALDVGVALQRLVNLEVVAPAGELQGIEAPRAGFARHIFQSQVGPLAGEKTDWSRHDCASL